jgi:hypothetical protein
MEELDKKKNLQVGPVDRESHPDVMSGSLIGSGGGNLPTRSTNPSERNQAEGSCTVTGTDDSELRIRVDHGEKPVTPADAEVFKKSRVTPRTPPRGRTFSFSGECEPKPTQAEEVEAEFDSPEEPHGKRRRGSKSSSRPGKQVTVMEKLKKKIEELVHFGKINQNVHREVKNIANTLNGLICAAIAEQKMEKELAVVEKQREVAHAKKRPETRNAECQTDPLEEEDADIINISGIQVETYEDFLAIQGKTWSAESFGATKVVVGNPTKENLENVIYFCDEDKDRRTKWCKNIFNKFPEILDSEPIPSEGGSYTMMEQTSKYRDANHQTMTKTKNIITVFYDPTKQDGRSQRDVYSLISKVKELVKDLGKEINLTLPQGVNISTMRKMCEIIFKQSGQEVKIHTPKNINEGQKKRTRGDAIVVDGKDMSYADMIKSLRTRLTDAGTVEKIQNVRKTANGNLLIKIGKDAESVKKKISEVLQNAIVKVLDGNKGAIVNIRDIDSTMCADEIKNSISETSDIQAKNKVFVKSLRPTRDGGQVATVGLSDEDGRRLIKRGKVRIGLGMCRVQERVEVIKCFRCWNYGHRAFECTGPDRRQNCLKCAQPGHLRKECEGESYCPLCDKKGMHEAGTSDCATFRRALGLERARRIAAQNSQ